MRPARKQKQIQNDTQTSSQNHKGLDRLREASVSVYDAKIKHLEYWTNRGASFVCVSSIKFYDTITTWLLIINSQRFDIQSQIALPPTNHCMLIFNKLNCQQ